MSYGTEFYGSSGADEEQTVTKATTVTETEFTSFLETAEPRLRRALVGRYGPDVGRDAAAEALAYAWEHWERLRTMSNPAGYLYRVGQSKARKYRSKDRSMRYAPAATGNDAHPAAVPTSGPDSEDGDPMCPGRPEQIVALHSTPDGYLLIEGLPISFGGPAVIWSSTNGIGWDAVTLPETGRNTAGVVALASDAGRYLALGATWDYPSIPPEGFPGGGCGPDIHAEPVAWTSTDGVAWTLIESPPFDDWEVIRAWFTTPGNAGAWILDDRVFVSLGGRQFTWAPDVLRG